MWWLGTLLHAVPNVIASVAVSCALPMVPSRRLFVRAPYCTRRDGYYLWTGHYQATTTGAIDAGWTGCTDGTSGAIDIPWGTHPGSWNDGKPEAAQPHEDDHKPWGGTHAGPQDCAMLTSTGWIDNVCIMRYYCLCELGRGDNVAAYTEWWAVHRDAWLASYRNNVYVCLAIIFAVGLTPGLLVVLVWLVRGRPTAAEWKSRVTSRVGFSMVNLGWLLIVFGITPQLMLYFYTGWVVEAGGDALLWGASIPFGMACLLLAVAPEDKRTLCWVMPLLLLFYVAFTLFGALTLMWTISWYTIAITLLGLAGVATVITSMCKDKDPCTKHNRMWLVARIFALLLGVVLVVLAILDASFFPARSVAYGVVAGTTLVMAATTSPGNRRRFCIWLAGLGRSAQEKAQADMAAKLIWVDLSSPLTPASGTEMQGRQVA